MATRNRMAFVLACAMAASAAAGAFGAGTDRAAPTGGTYADISPRELSTMGKDYFLVNTHVPYAGELPGTDAFIPYDQIASRIGQFPADRSAKIVLYCRSGHMSKIAARVLALAGYTNIFNLSGGMIAWEKAGLSIIQRERAKGS